MMLGMPIGLRSMINQETQPEWYKQMYNSLHQKHRRHNDFNNRVARNESNSAMKCCFILKIKVFFQNDVVWKINFKKVLKGFAEYILKYTNTLMNLHEH